MKKCPYSEFFWSLFFCIQSECGKIRNRKTPNTKTFHAVFENAIDNQSFTTLLDTVDCVHKTILKSSSFVFHISDTRLNTLQHYRLVEPITFLPITVCLCLYRSMHFDAFSLKKCWKWEVIDNSLMSYFNQYAMKLLVLSTSVE